jgi:FMN phosphatase YigB (HAD superfamily)
MKVVFDVGKVLAHAYMQWKGALLASGLSHGNGPLVNGHLYDLPEYLPYEGGQISEETYLTALAKTFELGSISDAKHLHESIIGEEYPGVAAIVSELNESGHQTATLSNNNPIHWAWFTQSGSYPAIESIQHLVASFHLGLFKPDPLIFPAFCDHLGWNKSEIVFLDDAPKNVSAAQEAGWIAHLISDEEPKADQIRRALGLT